MTIKPIETTYNGHRFRSRLEARWAVFFDTLKVHYEYEKEGYDIGELGYYLPDFWLPYPEKQNFSGHQNAGHWLEVKGSKPTDNELQKLVALSKVTQHSGILVYGPPNDNVSYFTHRSGNFGKHNTSDFIYGNLIFIYRFTDTDLGAPDISTAITAAKSARFEFRSRN